MMEAGEGYSDSELVLRPAGDRGSALYMWIMRGMKSSTRKDVRLTIGKSQIS